MRAAQKIEDKQLALRAYQDGHMQRWSKPTRLDTFASLCAAHVNVMPTVPRAMRPLPLTALAMNSPLHPQPPHPPTSFPPPRLIPPPFRRLIECEMQARRERGLCFRCDERFAPGHRCKKKSLQVLWVMDEEEKTEESFPTWDPASTGEELADDPVSATLCVSSLVEFCSPHSMKVHGKIMFCEVVILIDSDASHNFISDDLVSELQIRCTPTNEFRVQMGNGDEIRALGVCRDLCLQLAKINMVTDFFPLKLGASDVVLGCQWLVTLGDSLMNWGNLCLHVTQKG